MPVLFLIIFVALFVFGIWLYQKCRGELNNLNENAETLYDSVRNKFSPDAFLRASTEKFSASEAIMEGIPDTFVTIGILATFIGLGVAIQSAAAILNPDLNAKSVSDMSNLQDLISLLSVIAFKFQTSVWGIFFSLVFRRFIVERYFMYRQDVLDAIRNRLYLNERDGIRTLLEKQNDFLQRQADYQKTLDDSRSNLFNDFIATQHAEHSESIEQQSALNQNLLDGISALQKSLLDSQTQHLEYQKKINAVQIKQLNDFAATFTTTQRNFQQAMTTQFGNLQTAMLKAQGQTQAILNSQLDEISAIHTGLNENVRLFKEMTASVNLFSETAQKFSDDVFFFTTFLDKTQSQFDEITKLEDDMRMQLTEFIRQSQTIFIRSESYYLDDMRQNLSTMFEEMRTDMRKILNAMFEETRNSFREALTTNIGKVHEDYVVQLDHFNEVANALANAIEGINGNVQSIQSIAQKIDTRVDSIALESQNLFSRSEQNYIESINKAFEEMRLAANADLSAISTNIQGAFRAALEQDVEKIREEHNAELQKFCEHIDAVHDEYVELLGQFNDVSIALANVLEGINGTVDETSAVIDGFDKSARMHSNNLSELYSRMNETLEKFTESCTSTLTTIENHRRISEAAQSKKIEAFIGSLDALAQAAINSSMESVQSLQSKFDALTAEISSGQSKLVDELRNSMQLMQNNAQLRAEKSIESTAAGQMQVVNEIQKLTRVMQAVLDARTSSTRPTTATPTPRTTTPTKTPAPSTPPSRPTTSTSDASVSESTVLSPVNMLRPSFWKKG